MRLEHGAISRPLVNRRPPTVKPSKRQARVRAALDGLSRRERELLL